MEQPLWKAECSSERDFSEQFRTVDGIWKSLASIEVALDDADVAQETLSESR